mmetsp:Transcript_5891/g.6776  ORF Transcript_5891/g.6776 Transcript_5891/m.6776 type:complete len:234 (+) Transcript_5891:378-1079(+)
MSLNENGEVTALDQNGKQQSIKSMIESLRESISKANSKSNQASPKPVQTPTASVENKESDIEQGQKNAPEAETVAVGVPLKRSEFVSVQTQQDFLALLASLQFAIVVLLVRVRLPLAGSQETLVILSILLISAGHAKFQALVPTGEDIKDSRAARAFLFIVLPIFIYMVVCEVWFLYYLFFLYPDFTDYLAGFQDNAKTILTLAQALSSLKVVSALCFFFYGRARRCCKKRKD